MTIGSEEIERRYTDHGPRNGFAIGFTKFSLVDATRKLDHSNSNRKLEIFTWYPADRNVLSRQKPYSTTGKRSDIFSRKKNQRKASLETNAKIDVPLAASRERYPVIVFSHDLAKHPEDYTCLMEHLASEGYIVFSVNHPQITSAFDAKNDETNSAVYYSNLTYWSWQFNKKIYLKPLVRNKSIDKKWTRLKKVLPKFSSFVSKQNEQTGDLRFVLDFLEQLNSSFIYNQSPYNIFSKRLDLKKIGAMGHGWGGVAAVQMLEDKRLSASINLDGFHFTEFSPLAKPVMMLYSTPYSGCNDAVYLNGQTDSHTVDGPHRVTFEDSDQSGDNFYGYFNLVLHFLERYVKQVNHLSFVRRRYP